MHDPQEAQQEIISDFGLFDNWLDRYQYLIDLGKALEPLAEAALRRAVDLAPDDPTAQSGLVGGCPGTAATWVPAGALPSSALPADKVKVSGTRAG